LGVRGWCWGTPHCLDILSGARGNVKRLTLFHGSASRCAGINQIWHALKYRPIPPVLPPNFCPISCPILPTSCAGHVEIDRLQLATWPRILPGHLQCASYGCFVLWRMKNTCHGARWALLYSLFCRLKYAFISNLSTSWNDTSMCYIMELWALFKHNWNCILVGMLLKILLNLF